MYGMIDSRIITTMIPSSTVLAIDQTLYFMDGPTGMAVYDPSLCPVKKGLFIAFHLSFFTTILIVVYPSFGLSSSVKVKGLTIL